MNKLDNEHFEFFGMPKGEFLNFIEAYTTKDIATRMAESTEHMGSNNYFGCICQIHVELSNLIKYYKHDQTVNLASLDRLVELSHIIDTPDDSVVRWIHKQEGFFFISQTTRTITDQIRRLTYQSHFALPLEERHKIALDKGLNIWSPLIGHPQLSDITIFVAKNFINTANFFLSQGNLPMARHFIYMSGQLGIQHVSDFNEQYSQISEAIFQAEHHRSLLVDRINFLIWTNSKDVVRLAAMMDELGDGRKYFCRVDKGDYVYRYEGRYPAAIRARYLAELEHSID